MQGPQGFLPKKQETTVAAKEGTCYLFEVRDEIKDNLLLGTRCLPCLYSSSVIPPGTSIFFLLTTFPPQRGDFRDGDPHHPP